MDKLQKNLFMDKKNNFLINKQRAKKSSFFWKVKNERGRIALAPNNELRFFSSKKFYNSSLINFKDLDLNLESILKTKTKFALNKFNLKELNDFIGLLPLADLPYNLNVDLAGSSILRYSAKFFGYAHSPRIFVIIYD